MMSPEILSSVEPIKLLTVQLQPSEDSGLVSDILFGIHMYNVILLW